MFVSLFFIQNSVSSVPSLSHPPTIKISAVPDVDATAKRVRPSKRNDPLFLQQQERERLNLKEAAGLARAGARVKNEVECMKMDDEKNVCSNADASDVSNWIGDEE